MGARVSSGQESLKTIALGNISLLLFSQRYKLPHECNKTLTISLSTQGPSEIFMCNSQAEGFQYCGKSKPLKNENCLLRKLQ